MVRVAMLSPLVLSLVVNAAMPDVYVMDVAANDVPTSTAAVVGEIVTQALAQAGAKVLAKSDLHDMMKIEGDKQFAGCDSYAACLAEITSAMGVRYVVAGDVRRVEGNYRVAVRLIDTDVKAVLARETITGKTVDDLKAGAPNAARKLLSRFGAVEEGNPTLMWSGVAVAATAGVVAIVASVTGAAMEANLGDPRGDASFKQTALDYEVPVFIGAGVVTAIGLAGGGMIAAGMP